MVMVLLESPSPVFGKTHTFTCKAGREYGFVRITLLDIANDVTINWLHKTKCVTLKCV